jgi:hypothetical protein
MTAVHPVLPSRSGAAAWETAGHRDASPKARLQPIFFSQPAEVLALLKEIFWRFMV